MPTDCAAGKAKQEEKAEDCDEFVHVVTCCVCCVIFLIQVPVPFDCAVRIIVIALILYIVIFKISDVENAVATARTMVVIVVNILVDYFGANFNGGC